MSLAASRQELREALGIIAEKASEAALEISTSLSRFADSDEVEQQQARELRRLGVTLASFVESISMSTEPYPSEILVLVEQAIYPFQLASVVSLRDESYIKVSLKEFHSNSKSQFSDLMAHLNKANSGGVRMGALLQDPQPPQTHRQHLKQTPNFKCTDIENELHHAYDKVNNLTHCKSTHEKHLRQVDLRLQPLEEESFHLELIFNAKPACRRTGDLCLHETEMRVNIKDEERDTEVECDEDSGSEVESFCPRIAAAHDSRLTLSLVVDKKSYEPPIVFAGRSQSTLRDLVPGEPAGQSFSNLVKSFTPNDDVSLAYILTKSIWQLYRTNWLSRPWTSDDIYFLGRRERRSSDQGEADPNLLPTHYPYVRAVLPHSKKDTTAMELPGSRLDYSDEDRASLGRTFPDVLALGVLFIELIWKEKLWPQNDGSSTPIQENLFKYRAVGSQAIAEDFPSNYQLLLRITFEEILQKIFRNTLFRGHRGDKETSARRLTLQKVILDPIRRAYEVGVQGRMDIGHGELVPRRSGTYRPGKPTTDFDYGKLLGYLADGCGDIRKYAKIKCSIQELQQFAGINQFFTRLKIKGEPWKPREPIRVAVLDTGCNLQRRFFTRTDNPDEGQRIRWHDFVKLSPDPVDEDRNMHGTHIATLLLLLLPMCEIFVGRVATSEEEVPNSVHNIAEAINHAWKEWNVDIITMSWGFDDEKRAIKNAINEACCKREDRILFFAAANNDGFNEPELFPASHYKNVISVGGADHRGEPAEGLCPNPKKVHNEGVFSALGMSVPSGDWEVKPGGKGGDQVVPLAHSGCSFATPVLAATAALFLHYARFAAEHQPDYEKRLQKLFEPDGMRSLFRKIGQLHQVTAAERWFVRPKHLFKHERHSDLILDMASAAM